MLITCRVCAMKCQPNDDAVLLCGECRAQPDAMCAHVESVYDTSSDTACNRLANLSIEDTKRYKTILEQQIVAKKAGGVEFAQFQRRYQKTLQQADQLARYLEAQDAADRTARWYREAIAELDALVNEELFV